jgi:hypothetical protein
MDRVTFDQWFHRIRQAPTLDALAAVYELLCALPPSHERINLEQIWRLVRHYVAVGRPLPEVLAQEAPEAVAV